MFEQLKNILIEEMQVEADEIKPESELVNDLGLNSLELADLVLLCEDKYNIEINDDDVHNFVTVADVVDYLEKVVKK